MEDDDNDEGDHNRESFIIIFLLFKSNEPRGWFGNR